jgi:phospholipid/cholesterol/gamma-HCH transport system substrate-binding protein
MKNQKATEIKVGITVLLGLIVFIWVLGWAKNFTFTSSYNQLKVNFDNVAGLEIGNNVTVNGVKSGYVSDFYVEGANVIVLLNIAKNIRLNDDACFFLESTDLMGGRRVEIKPGTLTKPLDYSQTYSGTYRTDIAGVVEILSDFQDRFDVIVNETMDVLRSMNSILNDESFRRDLIQGVSNLNRLTVKLEQVLVENREDMKAIAENTREITSDTKIFIKENKENIENALLNLNNVLLKSDSLLTALNNITRETVSGGNNIGKILYDDSVYTNLVESMQAIKELTKIILWQIQDDGIKVDAKIF